MPGPDMLQALRSKRIERMAPEVPPTEPEAEGPADVLTDIVSRLEAIESKLGIAKPQPEVEPEPEMAPPDDTQGE